MKHVLLLRFLGMTEGMPAHPMAIPGNEKSSEQNLRNSRASCAFGDCIAPAAELVMGEADDGVPAAIVRGLGLPITDDTGVQCSDA